MAKTMIVRNMDVELKKALKDKANHEDKTLNGLILEILSDAVPEWNDKKKKEA